MMSPRVTQMSPAVCSKTSATPLPYTSVAISAESPIESTPIISVAGRKAREAASASPVVYGKPGTRNGLGVWGSFRRSANTLVKDRQYWKTKKKAHSASTVLNVPETMNPPAAERTSSGVIGVSVAAGNGLVPLRRLR